MKEKNGEKTRERAREREREGENNDGNYEKMTRQNIVDERAEEKRVDFHARTSKSDLTEFQRAVAVSSRQGTERRARIDALLFLHSQGSLAVQIIINIFFVF